tara:strand:- start:114 stop:536 length:423 start_codon:yes stop_codon:yes gene_type:complete
MSSNHYKYHKTHSIHNWKNKGVKSDDFDKLYEEHMSINNCQLCNIEFNKNIKNQWRCLDHDHKTGFYRQTICNKCNLGFDRPIQKNKKLKYKHIYFDKTNKSFRYIRLINQKRIQKQSVSLIKLIAFSFIQELKNNGRKN